MKTTKTASEDTAKKTAKRDPKPVAWFEIAGKDGGRLRSFYADLLGWCTADVAPGADYGVTDAARYGIGGGVGSTPTGSTHVTFFVVGRRPRGHPSRRRAPRRKGRLAPSNVSRHAALLGRAWVGYVRLLLGSRGTRPRALRWDRHADFELAVTTRNERGGQ